MKPSEKKRENKSILEYNADYNLNGEDSMNFI